MATMTMKLTLSDLTKVTKFSVKQIRALTEPAPGDERGVLVPEQSGSGRGCFKFFSVIQAVALVFGRRWADRGAPMERTLRLLETVLSYSEDELLTQFEAGRTHLFPTLSGKFKLEPCPEGLDDDCAAFFDLCGCYLETRSALEGMAKEARGVKLVEVEKGGRRSGLAEMT